MKPLSRSTIIRILLQQGLEAGMVARAKEKTEEKKAA